MTAARQPPIVPPTLRDQLPWVVGALLVVVAVVVYLLLTAPEENPLPQIYRIL